MKKVNSTLENTLKIYDDLVERKKMTRGKIKELESQIKNLEEASSRDDSLFPILKNSLRTEFEKEVPNIFHDLKWGTIDEFSIGCRFDLSTYPELNKAYLSMSLEDGPLIEFRLKDRELTCEISSTIIKLSFSDVYTLLNSNIPVYAANADGTLSDRKLAFRELKNFYSFHRKNLVDDVIQQIPDEDKRFLTDDEVN